MKRKIIAASVGLFLFLSGIVTAASINGDFNGNPIVKIYNNDKELDAYETPAIIYNSNTMVPIYLLKQLGVDVTWHQETYSVDVKIPEKVKLVTPQLTQERLQELAKSVAKVYGSTADPVNWNQGSGFVIAPGVLVTNYHVAGESKQIQYEIDGKSVRVDAVPLFANKAHDVMGFKVEGFKSLPYTTTLPQKNDVVHAIGYPAGEFRIGSTTVSSILEFDGVKKIMTNNIIDGGSSGGPLIDDSGNVLGITSSCTTDGRTCAAISMLYIQEELDKLR